MPSSPQIQWACYKKWKVEWEAQTGICRWSTSTFENSYGCTALAIPEWREMTEQIDWRARQPSQVACFSKELKCWGAWDTTCGHKVKEVTPSITCRRNTGKEEALDYFLWKGESIRWIITIIIDNLCIALFSGVHKLTALYNILQHLLSEDKMNTNVKKMNTGTVTKATLGKLLRDGMERIWAFPSA